MASTVDLVKTSAARFSADGASTHAAAIAYSVVFAIAPLMIVAIGIAGQALGIAGTAHPHGLVEDRLVAGIGRTLGASTAQSLRQIVDLSFASHQGSVLAQVIGWATFVLAASGLFLALQTALNAIWHVTPSARGIWPMLRDRLASAVMLLVVGLVILGTIGLNVALAYAASHVTALLPFPGAGALFSAIDWLVSGAVIAVLFATIYKVLPDTDIAWSDVRAGAIVTAILFVAGEAALGIYITRAGLANAYGAAGSIVIILVWAYYSAMLLLFGAELTRAYAETRGSRAGVWPPAGGDAFSAERTTSA
jgi:membrane protein